MERFGIDGAIKQDMPSINILRLSLSYDMQEDRLRLAVSDSEGRSLGLWLTRRLTMGLVSMMRTCLEGDSSVAGRTLPSLKANVMAIEHSDLIKPPKGEDAPPVQAQEPGRIVTGINLQRKGRGYLLIFLHTEEELAVMRLDRRMMHRFAGTLVRKMQDGGWTAGFDPDWLSEKKVGPMAPVASGRKKRTLN